MTDVTQNTPSKDVDAAYKLLRNGANKSIRSAKENKECASEMLAGLIKLHRVGEVTRERIANWAAGYYASGDGAKEQRATAVEQMMHVCGLTPDQFERVSADEVSDKNNRDAQNAVIRARMAMFQRNFCDAAMPVALLLIKCDPAKVMVGRNARGESIINFPERLIGVDSDLLVAFAPGSRINAKIIDVARKAVGVTKNKSNKNTVNRAEAENSLTATYNSDGFSVQKLSLPERKRFYQLLDAMILASTVKSETAAPVQTEIAAEIKRLDDLAKVINGPATELKPAA